jgi:DNA modification methylase
MTILLLNSNALHIPLAARSVNCIVTSPPYYGLRDYGVAPMIFGGDLNCAHVWETHVQPAANGIIHEGGMSGETLSGNSGSRKPKKSDFCALCNAWRGQYGLEPTPELFVEHTVLIFRECQRVLRDDGTLWLNLGDSYAGSGGVGNQRDDANKGNMPKFKNPNSYEITRSKDRSVKRWGGGNLPETGNLKPKDLIGIPWMVAFALRADGWYLRSDIIWHKPNPMPESVTDRPTKAHEYIFLLSKSRKYYYDAAAIREPIKDSSATRLSQDIENQEGSLRANGGAKTNGKMKAVKFGGNKAEGYGVRTKSGKEWTPKNLQYDGQKPRSMHVDRANGDGEVDSPFGANKKSVWSVSTQPYSGAHFATYPPALIEPCIKAGCPEGGIVLDPFSGSGTTALVARKLNRHAVGLDISLTYICDCAKERLSLDALAEWENGRKAESNHVDLPLFQELQ